jgi:hypothetical protein
MKNWNPEERVKVKEIKGTGKAKGKSSYSVEAFLPNKQRFRQRFNSYEEAVAKAEDLKVKGTNTMTLMSRNIRPSSITSEEEADYKNAMDQLHELLPGWTLMQAVRFAYDRKLNAKHEDCSVRNSVIEYAEWGEQGNKGKTYWANYMRYLGVKKDNTKDQWEVIAGSFADNDKFVEDVRAKEVTDIIFDKSKSWKINTQRSVRKAFSGFFNWAYHCVPPKCSKNIMQSSSISNPKEELNDVEIFTPNEARHIMETAENNLNGEMVPFFALALFGALRIEEISGNEGKKGKIPPLQWEKTGTGKNQNYLVFQEITNDEGNKRKILQVRLRGKMANKRVPTMPQNCYEWVDKYRKTKGTVCPPNWKRKYDYIRAKAGYRMTKSKLSTKKKGKDGKSVVMGNFRDDHMEELLRICDSEERPKWIRNGLRHSGCSYYLAKDGDKEPDFGAASTWAGNTKDVFEKHYDNAVIQADAIEFYKIRPSKD